MPEHLTNRYAPPSLQFNVHQLRRLLLMVLYQRLQGGAVAFRLAAMECVPLEACHLPALLLASSDALPPQLAFLLRVLLARAPLNEASQVRFRGLARRRGASEIPIEGRPDWFVVYQHELLLQTNVPPCMFSLRRRNFTIYTVLSEIGELRGK